MLVRAETPADHAAIHAVHAAAFPGPDEARLVDALRRSGKHSVSLVAIVDDGVVGHVLFSPVVIGGLKANEHAVGLAPLAVLPKNQRQGIGDRLVRAGLDFCRQRGFAAAIVLGDPAYYARFGFGPARRFGLSSEYDAPGDAFMAIELRPDALANAKGICRYADEFRDL